MEELATGRWETYQDGNPCTDVGMEVGLTEEARLSSGKMEGRGFNRAVSDLQRCMMQNVNVTIGMRLSRGFQKVQAFKGFSLRPWLPGPWSFEKAK